VVQQKNVDSFFGRLSQQDEEYMIDYYKHKQDLDEVTTPGGGKRLQTPLSRGQSTCYIVMSKSKNHSKMKLDGDDDGHSGPAKKKKLS
jgi:hypothetical protein